MANRKRFGIGDQVALHGIVRLVDVAGEDTVTIELLATGHRVTIRADSGHVDLIAGVAARHQGRLHRL
jgi:hypothetical protein